MTTEVAGLRKDTQRTRKEILQTATRLSRRQGFERIRMADIARHVGCSRATVYNHFPNRDLLLEALCTEYLQGFRRILEQVKSWAQPEHLIFEVLRETVAAELRWRVAHAELRGALDSAKRLQKDFYVREDEAIDQAMIAWFGSIYAASDELGLLRAGCDIAFATPIIYAMSNQVVSEFPVDTPPAEIARIADQVARLQWFALFSDDPDQTPTFGTLRLGAGPPA